MKQLPEKTTRIFAVAILLLSFSGCQTTGEKLNLNPFMNLNPFNQVAAEEETPDYQQPARMAVIWKETAVSPPGQKPTRGFGGRVYFYNQDNEAIRVDGNLTVFAFDDSNPGNQTSSIPERKYVFRDTDLQKHFSESELGPSYSVWLPWDKVGGDQKTVALMPVFNPTNGQIIQSDQSIAVLPGKHPDEIMNDLEAASMVRQVAASIPAGESRVSRLGNVPGANELQTGENRRTTTIRVPRGLANRMKVLGPQSMPGSRTSPTNESTGNPESADFEVTDAQKQVVERVMRGHLPPRSMDGEKKRSTVFGQPGARK